MHEKEITYFTEALRLAKNNYFIDAIVFFKDLINEFPDSDLSDDAYYNISLCYYEMNQFERSISNALELIEKYPEATITALENNNEFGKTAAKAYYLIINCHLALGQVVNAQSLIPELEKYVDSYIESGETRITFLEMAKKAIETYVSVK